MIKAEKVDEPFGVCHMATKDHCYYCFDVLHRHFEGRKAAEPFQDDTPLYRTHPMLESE